MNDARWHIVFAGIVLFLAVIGAMMAGGDVRHVADALVWGK